MPTVRIWIRTRVDMVVTTLSPDHGEIPAYYEVGTAALESYNMTSLINVC